MNAGVLIGKILLWLFAGFAGGIVIYLCYVLFKVSQKRMKGFLGDDSKPKEETKKEDKSRYCQECGNKVTQQNLFCPSCGGKLK